MTHPSMLRAVLAAAIVLAAPAGAQRVGRVCPDPAHPCAGFHAWDLSFVLPRNSVAREQVESEPFYAVVLRSGPACSIGERERAAAQARFADRKVFAQRFECGGDAENNVRYAGVRPVGLLAVYAGGARAEAAALLRRVQATSPGAYLRLMRVVYVYP